MTKWVRRPVTEELDRELKKLRDEIAKALGYSDVKIRDACAVLGYKNRKFKLNLTELRQILSEKEDVKQKS